MANLTDKLRGFLAKEGCALSFTDDPLVVFDPATMKMVGKWNPEKEQEKRTQKGLGLLHSVDMRDAAHPMRKHLASVDVLPDYKVWEHGEILDQGREGSCVGHGWTAWHNAKPTGFQHQQDHEYAVAWYERAQEIDEWPGTDYEGTSVRAGARVGLERDLLGEYVWASDLDDVDAWVLAKGPLVIGSKWYVSMDHEDANGFLTVDYYSGVRGGHCYLLYGKGSGGNYWFQNSWGPYYADEGSFRLTPDDLSRLIAGGGFVACSTVQTGVAG